jgi:DNA-directed RNA polymerase subunit H (RpoH/RPB5)
MNKQLMIFVLIFSGLNAFSQTKSFSSLNIDSLLIANQAHQEVGLPKAYCVDQIVRYYSNNSNYKEAQNYLDQYKSLNAILQNEDIAHRILYRTARLNFLISEYKELDTAAYIQCHGFFKEQDVKMCKDISFALASYLLNTNQQEYANNQKQQVIYWQTMAAHDAFIAHNYSNAALCYNNLCKLYLELELKTEAEKFWSRAILCEVLLEGNINPSISNRTHDLYYSNGCSFSLVGIESELAAADQGFLHSYYYYNAYSYDLHFEGIVGIETHCWTRMLEPLISKRSPKQYQEWLEIKNEHNTAWRDKELREIGIQQLKDSVIIRLPQGNFYYYDDQGLESVSIKESNILIQKPHYENETFEVQRSYSLNDSIKFLSVKKWNGNPEPDQLEYNSWWSFLLLQYDSENIRLLSDFYFENEKDNQDSFMFEALKEIDEHVVTIAQPNYKEYYNQNKQNEILKLPKLKKEDIPAIKKDFITLVEVESESKMQPFWYERFVLRSYEDKSKTETLRWLINQKGFNPYTSLSTYLSLEQIEVSFLNKQPLYNTKLQELRDLKSEGVQGVWIVEWPRETKILAISDSGISIWRFGYEEDIYGFPQTGKAQFDFNIMDQEKNPAKLSSNTTLLTQRRITKYLNELESTKVNGEFPEHIKVRIEQIAPIVDITSKLKDEGHLQLIIDGVTYNLISLQSYYNLLEIKNICGYEELDTIIESAKRQYPEKLPSIYEADPAYQRVMAGYYPQYFEVLKELLKRGYNPIKSMANYEKTSLEREYRLRQEENAAEIEESGH